MPELFKSRHFKDEQVKRNFFLNVSDGSIYSFAMSFVSLQTVLPVFVKKISGSDIAVGLIPVIWSVGFNFPQVFISNHVRQLGYKKPWMLKTALVQRIPWLILAFLSYFLIERVESDTALIIIFSGLALAAFGGSINLPGWFDLISKITPVQLRGRLFAYRSVLGAVMGIFGGWVVSLVLDTIHYPENFSLLFLLAFIVTMVSYSFLVFLKEEQPNHPQKRFTHKEFLKRLSTILKEEKNFKNFIVADSLMMLALMANAFLAVNALEKFSLPDAYAGYFTIVMMLSMAAGSLYFGYLADKKGHKLNLMWASIFTLIACLAALFSPTIEIYFICFAASALTITLSMVSRLTIIAEICMEDDRPTYISLTNLVTAPFVLSGLLGGWIASSFGYNAVFIIAGIFAASAFIWLSLKVNEPRNIQPVNN
ncbi:MAG TPA: MFS transporter [Ignavibacteriaceae bacterium]|nr:MFS transporter [Ignavibacteriaceae bacterium]